MFDNFFNLFFVGFRTVHYFVLPDQDPDRIRIRICDFLKEVPGKEPCRYGGIKDGLKNKSRPNHRHDSCSLTRQIFSRLRTTPGPRRPRPCPRRAERAARPRPTSPGSAQSSPASASTFRVSSHPILCSG
jgi:hypothetical protein